MSFLTFAYLSLVIALPLALGLWMAWRSLPTSRACPICRDSTLRLRSIPLTQASRVLPAHALHRRWCPRCEWSGVVRVAIGPTPAPALARGAPGSPSARRLDIRQIEVDGHRWCIVLECWTASRRWCGRLIFVAPSGRAWPDAGHFFRGDSPLEVVGQALSLSDLNMAGRVRKSVPI